MEMTNCPRCGKVFQKLSEPLCDRCAKEEEGVFERVRDYINDNPSNRLEEVARECNVTPKKIMKYIKDGRLEASSGMHGELTCEKCGKPVRRGKLCDACIVSVNHAISEIFDPAKQQRQMGSGMHSRAGER